MTHYSVSFCPQEEDISFHFSFIISRAQYLSLMLNKQNELLAHYSIFSIFTSKRKDPAKCDKVLRRHDLIPGFRNMTHFFA